MPTYDYACAACDATLEIFQSMKDDPIRDCPECGEPKLKRQIGTGAGILFKGSGFYETDYKRPADSGKADAAGSDGGGDAKTPGEGKKQADGKAAGSGNGGQATSKKADKAKAD